MLAGGYYTPSTAELTISSGPSEGFVFNATLTGDSLAITSIASRPDNATVIDLRHGNFYRDDTLAPITLTTIGNIAFASLTELYLPDSLTAITSSFRGCSHLTTVYPLLPASLTSYPEGLFRETALTGEVVMAGAGMASITKNMFRETKISSIDYSQSSVTSIGAYAAYGCGELTNVTPFLSEKVVEVGDHAFMGCEKLVGRLVIGDGVGVVPKYFMEGTAIGEVVVGSGVESIGECAFWSVGGLKVVRFRGRPPVVEASAFGLSGEELGGAWVLPKELRGEWEEYVEGECEVVELTEGEREAFSLVGLAQPTQRLQIGSSRSMYLCWHYAQPGLVLMVK